MIPQAKITVELEVATQAAAVKNMINEGIRFLRMPCLILKQLNPKK
jgi:hypothetical protein